ncbi:MAG: AIR synthase family protein [Lachnospiraceae bacterium]|nr:AIR synthase family protein [Lachnospiraceae bacterium]
MNKGKVSESILKRSILKKIDKRRSEVLIGAGVGEDCAVLLNKEDVTLLSSDVISFSTKEDSFMAVNTAANNLASSGAEPVGLMVNLLLPEDYEEPELKAVMGGLEEAAESLNMQIIGGHTTVTSAVNRAVISITGVGKAIKNNIISASGARAGNDVVLTKWIGLEGTFLLAKEYEAELTAKYPARMIYEAAQYDRFMSVVPEAAPAVKSGVTAMHDVSEGGIFTALWEMAEASHVGLEVELRKIPVKQETIEICNYFDINPYGLLSGGCMLMAAPDGEGTLMALKDAGIPATIIGKFTDSNDRILINGETKRFLDSPKADEILKVLK